MTYTLNLPSGGFLFVFMWLSHVAACADRRLISGKSKNVTEFVTLTLPITLILTKSVRHFYSFLHSLSGSLSWHFTQNGRNIQYLTISDVTCSKLVTAIDIFTGNWKPNQHFYTKAENIYATECHQVNTHTPNRNGRLSMRMRVCVSVCIVRIS